MAISIKDPETDELPRQLADRTGETITQALKRALRERLVRIHGRSGRTGLVPAACWRLGSAAQAI